MAVLISIKPKWCKLIESGKKTIEVRKSRPKCDVPFKCFIYCTTDKGDRFICRGDDDMPFDVGNGKVIGEFVCNEITHYPFESYNDGEHFMPFGDLEKTCLDGFQIYDYLGTKDGYGWHISDLKIYDNPKELREFYAECKNIPKQCHGCRYHYYESDTNYAECMSKLECFKPITRAPQSWMYVEELV